MEIPEQYLSSQITRLIFQYHHKLQQSSRRGSRTTSGGSDRMPDILRLEMLSLLHTKPLTGYELRKNIKASFNHEISFGTLYPNLASLERLGLIQGKWVSLGENQLRRKRIFTLTENGKTFLTENLDKLHKLTESMQKMNLVTAQPAAV